MQEAEKHPRIADEFRAAFKDDLLLFANVALWTYDPRKEVKEIPFLTWPHQAKGFSRVHEAVFWQHPFVAHKIGTDLFVEKSRDMGWSWLVLYYLDWRWRFFDYETFLVVSRSYDLIYAPGDPDTLFWKFQFIHDHLPEWLQPRAKFTEAHRENLETKSTIDGSSSNEDLGRGGRRTAILRDEDAKIPNGELVNSACSDNTNCQIRISTHAGPVTTFARDIKRDGANVITSHWSEHPEKAAGLYLVEDAGELTIVDKKFWTAERMTKYTFNRKPPKSKRFRFRSPWYDEECKGRTDRNIAENLDIDDEGSESLFFDAGVINKLKLFAREPDDEGVLEYDLDTARPLSWRSAQSGVFTCGLWFTTSRVGGPPRTQNYAVGADVSGGMGRTNSVLSVAGMDDGVKYAEIVTAFMRPEIFSVLAVAVCRWFKGPEGADAMLNFEDNGPGNTFADVAMELGFRNFWRRDVSTNMRVRISDRPGWHAGSRGGGKRKAFEHYRAHIESGAFTNYSVQALDECLSFVNWKGGVEHVSQTDKAIDPSEAKDNHGDRVTADMLADMIVNHGKLPDEKREDDPSNLDLEGGYPVGTFGWRRARRQQREVEAEYL